MLCSSISQSYLVICLLVSVFIDSLSCFLLGVCAKPGKLVSGTIVGSNYSYGSVIKFKCNKGYKLRGSAKLKCRRGVWEGQFPECEGKFMCNVNNNDTINISMWIQLVILLRLKWLKNILEQMKKQFFFLKKWVKLGRVRLVSYPNFCSDVE